jgi:hypothetical protein
MELFNPMRVEGFFGSYRQRLRTDPYLEPRMRALRHEEPAAFLYKLAFDAQGRRCVGFKFKYDELLLPQFSRHQAVIAQDLDIAIIHLRRRNLLKRYLSWVVVNRVTGRTMRTVRQESIDVPPILLDADECLNDFRETERRENTVRELFRHHRTFDLEYEDLIGEQECEALDRLQNFLGADHRPLKTTIAKISRNNLEHEIINFRDLEKRFANSRYADLFRDSSL